MTKKYLRNGGTALLGLCLACSANSAASNIELPNLNGGSAARAESADAHIIEVVAITQIYADGLKVSAVAIQYDKEVSNASLKASSFKVKTDIAAQKIVRAYASRDGLMGKSRIANGRYVMLELSTDFINPVPAHKVQTGPPPGGPPMRPGPGPEPPKEAIKLNPEVVTQVGDISWDPSAHPATLKSSKHGGDGESVSVSQIGDIRTADGLVLTPTSAARDNVYCRNLIVDGFMKPSFASATHGNVKYNIHFPSNYDPAKKYPVVVFLDDSDSPSGYTHAEFLIHGLGAVVWASKEDEAKHPAIVVVPASNRPLVNTSYQPAVETRPDGQSATPYLTVLDLLDGLVQKVPSMDLRRIYLTGQGDGARAALRMMADRPGFFAAALLFAPDYDPAKVAPIAKAKMWLVVSAGDDASYSSMQAVTEQLKVAGAGIATAEWSGQGSAANFAAEVRKQAGAGKNIIYTVLKRGTVVPSGLADNTLDNHAYTWRIGYSIQALRNWLFAQSK
jgi:predicted peptidase